MDNYEKVMDYKRKHGGSARNACDKTGVSVSTFYNLSAKLKKKNKAKKSAVFAEIPLNTEARPVQTSHVERVAVVVCDRKSLKSVLAELCE